MLNNQKKEKLFCHQCGNEIERDDKFCPNCGVPLKSLDSNTYLKKKLHEIKNYKFKSNRAKFFYEQSQFYLIKSNISQAFKNIQRAYDIEPENPMILIQLGILYFISQRFQKAFVFIAQALEYSQDNIFALEILLELYRLDKDKENVDFILQKFKELSYEYVNFLIERGDKFLGEDNLEAANSFWEKALELDPNNQDLVLRKNFISNVKLLDRELEKFHLDYDKAKKHYEELSEKYPDDEFAKQMIIWIEIRRYGLKI